MTFTSYAKDFQDVTLWRALGKIAGGSYIDAVPSGRGDVSLARAFQHQGWHGVYLVGGASTEHVPAAGSVLLEARLGTGTPDRHNVVSGISLDAVFASCAPGPVHWLHLDATDLHEGALGGWRRSAIRPWIIVVSNATATSAAWQAGLANKGYVLAGRTVDTLFYVLQKPSMPDVQLAHLPQGAWHSGALQQAVHAAGRRAALAEVRAEALQREAVTAQANAQHVLDLQRHLQAVFASTSWRVTMPLRWLARLKQSPGAAMRELLAKCVGNGPGTPKALLRRSVRAFLSRPAVRSAARRLVARHPTLARRLRARLHAGAAVVPVPVITTVPALSNPANVLGPRFRTLMLDDLAQRSWSTKQQGQA